VLDRPRTFLRKTRLLSLLMLWTSCTVFSLSPQRPILSPGTIFQYLIRWWALTVFKCGSLCDVRFAHERGKGSRCEKSVVCGTVVVARKTCVRVSDTT
jgi:hypothetical protein